MSVLPKQKPKITRAEIEELLRSRGVTDNVAIVGKRGYYRDSMGAPQRNDFGMYDDALIVVSPDSFATFNGNCDPSTVLSRGRALAQLIPGVYRYYKGRHKNRYNALRPFPEGIVLPCLRAGKPSTCSHINIHKGGLNGTWSEGCQTIVQTQYAAFINLVYSEMTRHNQSTIPYLLTDK